MSELSLNSLYLLLDVSLKTLLLWGGAWLFVRLSRIQDSNLKHRIWSGLLVGMLALPLLASVLPPIPLPFALDAELFATPQPAVSVAETELPDEVLDSEDPDMESQSIPAVPETFEKFQPNELSEPGGPFLADKFTDEVLRRDTIPEAAFEPEIIEPEVNDDEEEAPAAIPVVAAQPTAWNNLLSRLPQLLFGGWLLIASFCLLRLAIGLWSTSRLRKQSPLIDRQQLESRCAELAAILQSRESAVRECAQVRVPVTAGWLTPTVFLPVEWQTWSPAKLQAVLVHELTHVARRDYIVAVLAELNRCLYWFHPVAWWLRRHLANLAEEACDDAAIGQTGDPTAYASHLLEVASNLSAGRGRLVNPGMPMARESNVETRITAILDFTRPLSRRLTWKTAAAITVICIPVIALAAALQPGSSTDEPSEPPEAVAATDGDTAQNPTADSAETIGNEKATKQSSEAEPGFRIHGQVVDNDKHGIPNARVRLYRLQHRTWYASDRQAALVHEFQLDNEGRFDHRIPLDAFPEDERQTLFDQPGTDVLVVDAPGYVYATRTFADHSQQPPAQVVRLWKEVPVRGRILDPEGQPVENATISIFELTRSDRDKIDDWLSGVSFEPPKEPPNLQQMMSLPGALRKDRFPAKRNIQLPSAASPAATTNDKGEFELHGAGPDDLVLVNIQGEGIAKTTLHVLNRETSRFYAFHHSHISFFGAYYGREFEFVAQPSVPVFGVVRDIETKEPLAGVTIAAGTVYGAQMSHEGYLVTTTDEEGRYRLEGFPIPPPNVRRYRGNSLAVRPNPLPYIETNSFPVPKGDGLNPIPCDLELRRAVLAKGRLTDQLSGEPVQAKFYYAPFKSNEHVAQYSRYADNSTRMLGNDSRYYTDENGYFEIPVIPGRGVIAAKCLEGIYRTSFGVADIPEFADEEKRNTGQLALSDHIVPSLYHSLKEVNPAEDVAEIEIEMHVDSGQSLPVRFFDPDGNPLSGVRVIGLTGPQKWEDIEADHAEITGLGLGEIRPLRFYHLERKLARLMRLIPEKGQKELTIKLLPATIVSGRFIDPDGNPIEGVRLDANHNLDPDFGNSEGISEATGSDGKFEFPLPVGATYYISGIKADGTQITVAKDLEVTKPQWIDLGDLVVDPEGKRYAKVTAKRKPIVTNRKPEKPPKSDKKPATEADDASSADAKDQTPVAPATSTRFWGSLLDEDGNAVSGARVRLYRTPESPWPARRPASTLIAEFKLDANGQFDREFAIDDLFPGTERTQTTNDSLVLVASAPGYAWETTTRTSGYLKYMKPESIDFTLKKEMPIEGRIVDLEGQPIPSARVRVFDITHSKSEKLEEWISNAATTAPISGKKQRMMRRMAGASPSENELYPRERNLNLPAELTQEIVTEENGRFVVEGIAPDDLVQLVVEGRGIAKVMLDVVAREMKTVYAPKRGPLNLYGAHYGRQFTCIAQPSVSVTGVIRDIETKTPLADIEVTAYGQYGDSLSLTGFHLTKTDSSGRYRFEGLPVASSPDADERNRLSVFPYPLPYIELDWLPMPAGDGVNPVEFDVELRRAVMVKGRLTNKVTGEPVWARMYYSPFNTNPHLSEYKRYADQTSSLLGNETRYVTDEKGYFEIPVIPGRGVVGARSWDTTFRPAYGANEIEEFADERKEGRVTSDYLSPSWYHSLIEVSPAQDDTEINVEMQIDPGLSLTVNFVDERGQPLSGVVCEGLQTHRRIPVAEDHAQALGLAAGEVRWLDARHEKRKLARMFRLVPEEGQEEITVQLLPMTIVSGRLVDQYGSPVSDVVLESRHQNDPDFGGVLTPRQRTDRDGRFEYELPIGASSCRLIGFQDKYFTIFKDHDVTIPQQIDLGDMVVDPDAKQWAEVTAKRKPIVTDRKLEESTETKTEPAPALEESTPPAKPVNRSSTKSNSRNDRTEPLVFSGNVVDPNGKPVEGTAIHLIYGWRPEPNFDSRPLAVTDKRGEFRFTLTPTPQRTGEGRLVAVKEGYAFAHEHAQAFEKTGRISMGSTERSREWLRNELKDATDTLRLLPDNEPIRGRIVDTEGQPVAGAVVQVKELYENKSDNLSEWEAAATSDGADLRFLNELLSQPITGTIRAHLAVPVVKTGDDGWFALRGLGNNRIAKVVISHPEIATAALHVRPQPGKTIEVLYDADHPDFKKQIYYPNRFTYVASPCQILVGRVTEKETGKPVPNCFIRYDGGETISTVNTRTNANGEYRLRGLPLGYCRVDVIPPFESSLMPLQLFESRGDSPLETITRDVELPKAVIAEGRAVDTRTGQPVAGSIQYVSYADNPHLELPRGMNLARLDYHYLTSDDGRFQIPILPGEGLILFRVNDGRRFERGVGSESIPKSRFQQSPYLLRTQPFPAGTTNYHLYTEVSPQPDDDRMTVDLKLTSGIDISGRVVRPDGSDVEKYWLFGSSLYPTWLPPGTSDTLIEGYYGNHPQRVIAWVPEENLVGSIPLEGELSEPLTIELQPAGHVTGRLVDEEGLPLAGLKLSNRERLNYEFARFGITVPDPHADGVFPARWDELKKTLYTDEDGRFRVSGLVPGLRYSADVSHYGQHDGYSHWKSVGMAFEKLVLKPGENRDVGDIVIKIPAD